MHYDIGDTMNNNTPIVKRLIGSIAVVIICGFLITLVSCDTQATNPPSYAVLAKCSNTPPSNKATCYGHTAN